MRAYVKFALILFSAVAVQAFVIRDLSAFEDVQLAARAFYLDRYGTDAERRAFDDAVDAMVIRERSKNARRLARH